MAEHRQPLAQLEGSLETYSPTLLPLFQSLLSTLADMDFAHDHECQKIVDSTTDLDLRKRKLEKLQQEHDERREPYIQHLAALQGRAWPNGEKH